MKAAPTLHPGDQFARYSIVGPLGAGGMGEVYLAQDRALERNVALKVLPPALVRSEERVRRFMLEAKSASSLNHPNIVTIYEIGQERLRSGDGSSATDSSLIHFISMELVTGKTLSRLIHEDKTDLRALLGILAQVAEGVAKAHAAGIVHRDLKPGNIMVTGDGFAKVLDFGLAKLTERREEPDATSAGTLPVDQTDEGAVVGTAGYMSPEQVQGKPADHRSDVFSFGCVLYEAVTGRRPFSAESSIETMHRILNDKPAPIEELNPRAPAEVRRLIRRCLAKNPEQRYQSMKDLAIELREIVDEFDALSPSGSSGGGSTATATTVAVPKRSTFLIVIGSALAVVAIATAIGVLVARRGTPQGPPAIRMTTVTDRGDVGSTTISPDGRYLAYQSGPPGRVAIWVRQIATGSDVQILPAVADLGDGLTFSPDGNYLYYLRLDPEHRGYRALYQVPSLGGRAVKRTYDVDSEVSFAPDGKQVCFWRGVPTRATYDVVIVNLDTGAERVVASVPDTRQIGAGPCWSPRGDRIATAEVTQPSYHAEIALYRVKDGRRETVATPQWPQVNSLAWMPGGRAVVVEALDLGSAPVTQLRSLSIPAGRTREITHDLIDYSRVSVSADGKTLATQRTQRTANLWMAPVDGTGEPHPITTTSGSENAVQGFTPTLGGPILFSASSGRYMQVWTVDPDGSDKRALTNFRGYVEAIQDAAGGAVIGHIDEDTKEHVSRLDADGGLHPLVPEIGAQLLQVTLDGTLVAYTLSERPHEVWIIPSTGGLAKQIADDYASSFQFSRDGRRLIYLTARTIEGRPGFIWRAKQISGEPDSVPPLPPRTENLRWMLDNASLSYIDRADSCWNVYRRPLAGGDATPITHVREGRIISHLWSPDGTRLALVRQIGSRWNLWIAPADGGEPRRLTNFQAGTIFGFNWTRDGKSIVFMYGDFSKDAVLIRDFE